MPTISGRTAAMLAALGLLMVTTAACGGSDEQGPNADAAGLFPAHYQQKGFMDAGGGLVTATAATGSTRTYSFDVDVSSAFALVAHCTRGEIDVSGSGGPCTGGPSGVIGFCSGQHAHLTAHVSDEQPHAWGVAVYRTAPC